MQLLIIDLYDFRFVIIFIKNAAKTAFIFS